MRWFCIRTADRKFSLLFATSTTSLLPLVLLNVALAAAAAAEIIHTSVMTCNCRYHTGALNLLHLSRCKGVGECIVLSVC